MGSSPAFTPSARPSIMASPLTQAIMLLIAFAVFPAPTGPTWKMFGPMARSTGWARFKGSASPPTMIASVAARAPLTPPLTGASRKCTPRSFARGSIFFGVEGSTLLRSMRIVPGLARRARLPRPGLEQVLHGLGVRVEDRHRERRLHHVQCHGIAHVSDPDESDRIRHLASPSLY